MDIWFDIAHIPQFNFYKWIMTRLASDGHHVYLTVLDRGKLAKIVQKEIGDCGNIDISVVGKHRSTKLSAILEANLIRNVQLFLWICARHIDLGFSNGYQLALMGWLRRFPTYSFDDDPETMDYRPKLWFNTKAYYCIYDYGKKLSPKATILPVLKEWSYLAPAYFQADVRALDEYGLKPKEYIFVREVSVGTVNYSGQAFGAVRDIAGMIPRGFKVLLSLEKKDTRDQYPEDWILLKEPLKDIRSLIYFSAGLVSSGDSMAREAALMGVPSYYLGIRHTMPANMAASRLAGLQNRDSMPFEDWADNLGGEAAEMMTKQDDIREGLTSRMTDVNRMMYDIVNDLK